MPRSKDLSGEKYNLLTVVSRSDLKTANGQWRWNCVCDCGTKRLVNTGNLQCGRTKSCGCLQRRRGKDSPQFKHGLSQNRQSAAYKKYQRECFDRCRYKLEPETKAAMLAAQKGKCAICHYAFGQKVGDMKVDHDHKTGAVRGLLCDHCNRGLGFMRDNPDLLARASKYVSTSFKSATAR